MNESIYPLLNNKEWLTDQVVKYHKNCAQIARELGIANRSAVNRAVKRLGLSDKIYRTKFPLLSNKEWLQEQLQTKTLVQIAKEIGTTPGNVGDRIKRYKLTFFSTKSEAVKAGLKKKYPNGSFGKLSSHWKGGRRTRGLKGYVTIYTPDHPRANNGAVFEHILVAEEKIGRYLTKDEIVHHINGKKDDNRPKNLEIVLRKDHVHKHFTSGKNIQDLLKENARLKEEIVRLKQN